MKAKIYPVRKTLTALLDIKYQKHGVKLKILTLFHPG